jgi:MFS family permease
VSERTDRRPRVGRGLLRDPVFVRLWVGATAAGMATWALPFVLGLAVVDGALSAAELGLALGVRTAGFIVAVPAAGVFADRRSRRGMVAWSSMGAAAAAPLLAVGVDGSVWLLVAGAALSGAGQGACRPAFQALTAEVVDRDRLQPANAAMTLAVRVTTMVGPSAAALLAVVLDVRGLLLGIGLLWLVAALGPAAGRPREGGPPRTDSLVTEFTEGVREARRHPWFVAGLSALSVVIATGYSATAVVLPLVSRDRYSTQAVLAGALTAYTVGALLGALVIARWRPRSPGWVALAALGLYGLAPLSLLVPVPALVVVAAYLAVGVGIELFNVPWFTATQREVAPDKLARVSSLDFLVSYGLAPVGLALIAPAMDAFGTHAVLITCTLACLAAPAAAALEPTTRAFSRRGASGLRPGGRVLQDP